MPRKKKPGPKPKASADTVVPEKPKENEPTSSSGPDEEGAKTEDKPPEPEPEKPVMPIKRPRGRPSKKWQAQFLGKVFPEPVKTPKKERKPREKKDKAKDAKAKKTKTGEKKEKKEESPKEKESAPTPKAETPSEETEQKPKETPPSVATPKKKPSFSYLASLKAVLDKLYEYRWPQDMSGEYYLLEWQLADFLGINTLLQSKHPDLEFHQLEDKEMEFLKEKGILSSCPSDRATIGMKTDDALLLLLQEYPEKYQDFIQLSHKREKYNLIKKSEDEKKAQESQKMPNARKRALKDVVEFNAQLALQRNEERCSYFDMQTQIIHVPSNKTTVLPKHMTQPSKYPVSLLPGQFQEHFKRYFSAELRKLPLGTVLDGAMAKEGDASSGTYTPRVQSDTSEGSSSSSSSSDDDDSGDDSDGSSSSSEGDSSSEKEQDDGAEPAAKKRDQGYKPPFRPDALCGICLKGSESNRKGFSEDLIHCSQCENSGHPSCLDMSPQLVRVIETYPWQCMECKTCTLCRDPFDEDKMLFCDECDRGYHSFCVGLQQIPVGRWTCELCGVCASCLRRTPGEGPNSRWKSEYTKPRNGEEPQFLQTLCTPCSRLFRSGNFCPVCLKVYRNDESDLPMVCCDECDRWVHTDCDGIDDSKYAELAKDKTKYRCILCRGEKEERMDSFARKNRDHQPST